MNSNGFLLLSLVLVMIVFANGVASSSSERRYSKTSENTLFKTVNAVHLKTMGKTPQEDLWFYNCTIELPTLDGAYVDAYNEGHWRRRVFFEKNSRFLDTRAYYRSSAEEFTFEQVSTLVTGQLDQEIWEVEWTTPHVAESRLSMYLNIESRAYGSDLLYTVYKGEKSGRVLITEQIQSIVPFERHFLSMTFLDDPVGVFLPVRSRCDCQVVHEDEQPTAVRSAFLAFEAHHVPLILDSPNVNDDLAYIYKFPGTHDDRVLDEFYRYRDDFLHWADYFGH